MELTTDWPEVVDIFVTESDDGLFVYYVQTPDEHAVYTQMLSARTRRAALIELTSELAEHSYQPTERWNTDDDGDSMRRFRATSEA
jgi:hypothetical protein